MRLDEITTDDIQRFLNKTKCPARNTIHTMLVLIGEVFASAYKDKLILSELSKSKRLSIASKRKIERNALKPVHLEPIIKGIATKLDDDNEQRLIALFVFTGIRRRETPSLRWED